MKKILFSGQLAEDGSFVEIAICDYSYRRNGEKNQMPYISILEIDNILGSNLYSERNLSDLFTFVSNVNFTVDELQTLLNNVIKNIVDLTVRFNDTQKFLSDLQSLIKEEENIK